MKLLLIDDHVLFRDGLSMLMSHRLTPAGGDALHVLEAGSLSEAQQVIADHPDVALVLLDLGLAAQRGLGTLQQWRAMAPDTPVVVLSADDRTETIVDAIDGGASGFIPKTVSAPTMLDAMRHVLGGGVYLPPLPESVAAQHDDDIWIGLDAPDPAREMDDADTGMALGLSPRQLDVLRLLVDGKANKEICRRLNLSESTIKTHLTAIFRKLRVRTRTQAVVAVAQAGISLGSLGATQPKG
jgi:DNA-binding NarL/FixJ family response regulator